MDIKRAGIYKIENIVNGEFYVGSSTNLQGRRRQHFSDLKLGKSGSKKMQEDYDLYGRPCFRFVVIEFTDNIDALIQGEQKWIDTLKPTYNTNEVAGKYIGNYARTEEALQKLSISVKKLWENPEYAAKHCKPRNWKNGIPNRKGVKLSDETKEKIRQANLGENNPNYGKPRPQSFIDKMAKTYSGVISPDGIVYTPITNMRAFCKEHKLDSGQMSRLMSGKVVKYKGWTKV